MDPWVTSLQIKKKDFRLETPKIGAVPKHVLKLVGAVVSLFQGY
jgi:hypothetical protein